MSEYTEHARRELELLGEDPELTENLVACVELFASFDHSGASAEIATQMLADLLRWKNLAPITSDPAQWMDRSEESGTPLWQCRRNPALFSINGGATWYDVSGRAPDAD